MITNIVWDVDGTLFNTYPAITYALSKSLNIMGKPVALNLIDGLARQSFHHCVDTLCRRYKVDVDELQAQFVAVYCRISPKNQPPIDGTLEVCEWIKARGGKNVAVLYRENKDVQRLFDVHRIGAFFAGVHGFSLDSEPDLADAVFQKYHLDPVETLVIGDRVFNIQAGRAAGCQTCLVGDEVLAGQVDMCITDYKQLLEKIQAQAG